MTSESNRVARGQQGSSDTAPMPQLRLPRSATGETCACRCWTISPLTSIVSAVLCTRKPDLIDATEMYKNDLPSPGFYCRKNFIDGSCVIVGKMLRTVLVLAQQQSRTVNGRLFPTCTRCCCSLLAQFP